MKLRWLLPFIVVIAVSYLLAGQLTFAIQSTAQFGNGWVNRRYKTAMGRFSDLKGRAVLVLGASEIESGFKPDVFDQFAKDANLRSYNFAFRNMSPTNLGSLVQQMKFSRHDKLKVESIYIKFAPSDLTHVAAKATAGVDDEVSAQIFSRHFLLSNITMPNLKTLAIKELQGGYSTANLNQSLRSLYLQALSRFTGQNFMLGHPLDRPRYHLWVDPDFNGSPEWDLDRRGFHERSKPSSARQLNSLIEMQQRPDYLNFNFQVQERRSEVISLNFSPKLISDFKSQLSEVRKLSDQVVLFYFPDHPKLPRTEETKVRVENLLTELCNIEHIRCLRLDRAFSAIDYYDAFHLTSDSSDKLSRLLAEDFKNIKTVK